MTGMIEAEYQQAESTVPS